MVLITVCTVYAIEKNCGTTPLKTAFLQVYNMVLITVCTV
jgi:hypothetical protein